MTFDPAVIRYMLQRRQKKSRQKEAGGQLFGKLTPYEIYVQEATGPRASDFRARTLYKPDRKAEQIEINERFSRGLVYLGDWHSHPEAVPEPSSVDSRSMAESFRKSTHNSTAFLLVIVGSGSRWDKCFVALYGKSGIERVLQPHERAVREKQQRDK